MELNEKDLTEKEKWLLCDAVERSGDGVIFYMSQY